MAGESTYNAISALVPNIYEIAFLTASEQSVMQPLVHNFTDNSSGTGRIWESYTGGTVVQLAEISDMSAQTFTPAAAGTLSPYTYSMQYYLTDLRISSDPMQVQADAGSDLGRAMAVKVDSDLVGLFSSLTGGTVGTAGGTITWANVHRAMAYARSAYAPDPLRCVLRPEQWYYLTSATSGVPTLMSSPAWQDALASKYFVGSWGGCDFFVDGNITSGTAAVGGMFNAEALAYDERRAFRIETQRDASRGGGGWELNATIIYAKGVYRATFGVQMIGTSA